MKYRFISEQHGNYRVEKMAGRSGTHGQAYYEWMRQGEPTTARC